MENTMPKLMEIEKGYYQNVVPTTGEQNIAAAKCCGTFNEACGFFRSIQYSNNMGTHGGHFEELERFYNEKKVLTN
jgi:hypothetical protein